ncbi:MAG: methyl-accepting chemotaxis protein, partial [Anaerolineae bacterium]|nr:methyl-accepting chemotaxis protein [Anaerolineae bacterium]
MEKKSEKAGKVFGININNWSIRTKIFSTILGTLILSIGITTAVSSMELSQKNISDSGEKLAAFNTETVLRLSEILDGDIKSLKGLAITPDIIDAVEKSNKDHQDKTPIELQNEIKPLDDAWKAGDESIKNLIENIISNPESDLLRNFLKTFPEEVEVFVTDKQGLNIAMSSQTSDYLQSDEEWWQQAYDDGKGKIFISNPEYDESSKVWAMDVGIPIKDREDKAVIGILRGTINITTVVNLMSQIKFGNTGYATLLGSDNTIYYTRNQDLIYKPAPEAFINEIQTLNNNWSENIIGLEGVPVVLSQTQMAGGNMDFLGWKLIISQEISEVNQSIIPILTTNIIIAVLLAIFFGLYGFMIINSIDSSLKILEKVSRNISEGNLAEIIHGNALDKLITRGDEIGKVGRSFNFMIQEYLKPLTENFSELAKGNLTVSISPKSAQDELGLAAKALSQTLNNQVSAVVTETDNLNVSSSQLADIADQAKRATSQIATTIQQIADGATQQSNSINRIAASIESMHKAIKGVAQGAQDQATSIAHTAEITVKITRASQQVNTNTRSVSQQSAHAADTAREGARVVETTIDGMGKIKTKVGFSAQKVRDMGQRSDEIGAIVQTIEEIASQTNMLALNAAIEAARAG